jgi:hypothetical protein
MSSPSRCSEENNRPALPFVTPLHLPTAGASPDPDKVRRERLERRERTGEALAERIQSEWLYLLHTTNSAEDPPHPLTERGEGLMIDSLRTVSCIDHLFVVTFNLGEFSLLTEP